MNRLSCCAAAGCAAVALAGCGTVHASERAGTATATHITNRTPPQQRAAADTASRIRDFIAPPGALRTGKLAVALLAQPGSMPLRDNVVTSTGWWRAGGDPSQIFNWIRTHKPRGYTLRGYGGPDLPAPPGYTQPYPSPPVWDVEFQLPDMPGVLIDRALVVTLAAYKTGETALRVDAEAIWLPVKPAGDHIPAAARVVTITPEPGGLPLSPADHALTITDPAKLARIATFIDALPMLPPYRWLECGPGPRSVMRLTFRAAPGRPALAVVTAYDSWCQSVTETIGGKTMPGLRGAAALEQQVMSIAGFRWTYLPQPATTVSPTAAG